MNWRWGRGKSQLRSATLLSQGAPPLLHLRSPFLASLSLSLSLSLSVCLSVSDSAADRLCKTADACLARRPMARPLAPPILSNVSCLHLTNIEKSLKRSSSTPHGACLLCTCTTRPAASNSSTENYVTYECNETEKVVI